MTGIVIYGSRGVAQSLVLPWPDTFRTPELGRGYAPHYNNNKLKPRTMFRFEVGMGRREPRSPSVPISSSFPAGMPSPVSAPVRIKRPALSASAEEWRDWLAKQGHQAFRARQVLALDYPPSGGLL